MVDTRDLKSLGQKCPCGFDSHLRYFSLTDKIMTRRSFWRLATLIFAALTILLGIYYLRNRHNDKYEYIEMLRIHEAELKYWENKSKLVDEVQTYIESVAPFSDLRAVSLVDECENYSVDLKFVLAQGFIESHFGTAGLASKTNSVWNVGAYTNKSFKDITRKYKYMHPNESIVPYLELLTSKYLTVGCEEELLKKFVDHNGKRFATDTKYEERLSSAYRTIANTTQIDSLQAQVRYWKLRANR